MNPVSITAVAKAFTVASVAAGIPSLAMLLFYAVHSLRQRSAAAPTRTEFGDNPDALLWMLKVTTRVLESVGGVLSAVAQLVLDLLAVASGIGLVAAVLCWFIGQGLMAQAAWARWGAGVMLTLALAVTLLGMLSTRELGRVAMFAMMLLCALGLHAVWTGHGPVAR